MKSNISKKAISAIIHGTHGAPYDILGMHPRSQGQPGISIRAFQPYASRVEVLAKDDGKTYEMEMIEKGFFECIIPEQQPLLAKKPFHYKLRMTGHDNHQWVLDDPYQFPLQITDFDLYLIGEGNDYRMYKKMGAHPMTIDGVEGVHFAVWAPNAIRVSVIGWFNRWDGKHHPMQKRADSGLWELFLPELKPGDMYKFEIKGRHDYLVQKADPYGFAFELRPQTASVVWDITKYKWNDQEWVEKRKKKSFLEEPISVYEVHLGSWRRVPEEGNRWLTYKELANNLVPYVKEMGFTHIELLPITEHPFDGSWGYQTIGYFAPTSRFGTPDDFKYFVDCCHQCNIGVILDWVPAHFPKDGHGLSYFDGTHLYEHSDWRIGEHKEWGTFVFNYGRNEVRDFLLSSAMFWADVYHVDGLRVDAVASMLYLDYSRKEGEWIPNKFGGRENLEAIDFLKKFNIIIHEQYPGFLTYAEESTAWPMVSRPVYLGGLGFDLKWNMGWMHDILEYISKDPVHRKYHHNDLTFSLLYAFTENFILPFSHDEVVHGKSSMIEKMPGDHWQKFATLRLLYSFMFAHPGKKLLFMGSEFAQWEEWNYKESLAWHQLDYDDDLHIKLRYCLKDLNKTYRTHPEFHEIDFSWDGFQWVDFHDWEQSMLSFVRKGKESHNVSVCVFNFTPVPRSGYRVGVPFPGYYKEIFNSDSELYGGGNMGNAGVVPTDPIPWQGFNHSLLLTIPALSAVYLRPDPKRSIDQQQNQNPTSLNVKRNN
jgi:1,4-alpha-glucan branching enzyme